MDRTTYLIILSFLMLTTASIVDYGTVEMYAAMNISTGYKALIAICTGAIMLSIAVIAETSSALRPAAGVIKGMLGVSFPIPAMPGFDKFAVMIVEFWALIFAAAQFDSAITMSFNLHITSLLFKLLIMFISGTLGVFATVFFALAFDPSEEPDGYLKVGFQ